MKIVGIICTYIFYKKYIQCVFIYEVVKLIDKTDMGEYQKLSPFEQNAIRNDYLRNKRGAVQFQMNLVTAAGHKLYFLQAGIISRRQTLARSS